MNDRGKNLQKSIGMKIYVVVKAVGKTRGFNKIEIELEDIHTDSVASLISFFVNRVINRYEYNIAKVLVEKFNPKATIQESNLLNRLR